MRNNGKAKVTAWLAVAYGEEALFCSRLFIGEREEDEGASCETEP